MNELVEFYSSGHNFHSHIHRHVTNTLFTCGKDSLQQSLIRNQNKSKQPEPACGNHVIAGIQGKMGVL